MQIVEAWTQELHLNPEDSALPREMPVCLPEREMDLQTTEELAVPGAMEAFSRMDRLQETRAVANKAIEALHDMNIHETKEPSPVEEKPQKGDFTFPWCSNIRHCSGADCEGIVQEGTESNKTVISVLCLCIPSAPFLQKLELSST